MSIITNNDLVELNNIKIEIEKNFERNFFLAKKEQIDYIYNTSALKGNTMSYVEVQTYLSGASVKANKSDSLMVLNQNNSLNLLFELIKTKTFDHSKDIICKLNEKVSYEESIKWGAFRDGEVRIGGTSHCLPKTNKLDEIFTQNYEQLNKVKNEIVKEISLFLINLKNQYFYNGNKRTSRLAMNGILIQNGYEMINIKIIDKLDFNQLMINYYNGQSIAKSVEFLISYYCRELINKQDIVLSINNYDELVGTNIYCKKIN